MIDTRNIAFPVQKLPLSKKNTDWKEASVNSFIARQEGVGYMGDETRKGYMATAYGLYNSDYNEEDLKYVTDPFKVEDGFPAKTQEFNIIRPKIDLLIGEESKRPFNIKVIQTNGDVVTQLQEQKKSLLLEYVMGEMGGPQQDEEGNPITPEEIDKYLKFSYKSVAENTAYHSLNYLKEKLNLPNEFLKGWRDGLIGGEEIYYVGMVNGEPALERVNPLYGDFDKDPDLEFIEDGEYFVRRMEMSPATIYDRFFDIMDESDLDEMLEYSGNNVSRTRPDQVNNPSVMYKEKMSSKFFNNESHMNLLTVWHVTWRSYKKIGFLTMPDGNTEIVDENYKADKGESIKWEWVPEIWEGYRIGERIFIGIEALEYQHVSVDSPSNKKLPYCGVIYSNTNSRSKSLVSIMKPLQYMYIILWYRLELALARDKGKVINMDITQIPKGLGIDVNQWMHYLTALGVNFINPYDEGWDIPGREGGKPSPHNQINAIDLTMSNVINEYIGLMAKVEDMIGEISGVSKARQGQIHQSSLVGNVEREVIQSSHITEPLFWNHNQAKKNALTMLLDVAKFAWAEKPGKNIHYILNDTERIFLEVEPDFVYADLDVFLSDSTEEDRNIEALKTLLQPAMQNGATLLDAAEIMSADNFSMIKRTLGDIEKKREEMMAQQQQVEQQQVEMQMQMEQTKMQLEEQDSIRKSQTAIEVALINAESKDGDGEIDNNLDQEKLGVQIEKQQDEAKFKDDTLAENVRKNKKGESQRQEEIEIKRKQANKPVAAPSKK
ncbi:MAG: portal protein [Candidatus Heimdallarchaeaceae archaeon]